MQVKFPLQRKYGTMERKCRTRIKAERNKHKEVLYLTISLLLFPICDVIQVFAMFNMAVF